MRPGALAFQIGLGEIAVDDVSAAEDEVGQRGAVFLAVAGLAEQAEVAVGGVIRRDSFGRPLHHRPYQALRQPSNHCAAGFVWSAT